MRHFVTSIRTGLAAAAVGALVTVTACDSERTAEADTPVSEAEVSTDLPESAVSDQQLQATANVAADIAATPPPEVVPVPVPVGNQSANAGGGNRTVTNNDAATNTTRR